MLQLSALLSFIATILFANASFTRFPTDYQGLPIWLQVEHPTGSYTVKDLSTWPTTYTESGTTYTLAPNLALNDVSTFDQNRSSITIYQQRNTSDSNRSEFRFPNFSIEQNKYSRISLSLYAVQSTLAEYTFVQLHQKDGTRPPLRITSQLSQKDGHNVTWNNYIWAIILGPNASATTEPVKIPLFPHPGQDKVIHISIYSTGKLTDAEKEGLWIQWYDFAAETTKSYHFKLDYSKITTSNLFYHKTGVYCSGSGVPNGSGSVEYMDIDLKYASTTPIGFPSWWVPSSTGGEGGEGGDGGEGGEGGDGGDGGDPDDGTNVPPINDDEEEPEDTPGAGYTNSVSAVLFIVGAAMLTILG